MKRLPKPDQIITVDIPIPNWTHPLRVTGIVGSTSKNFGGRIHIKKGAICEDEFVIRLESIIK